MSVAQQSQLAILEDFERRYLPSLLEPLLIEPIASLAQQADVTISIKRDDLIHPVVSGNKWRKLTGNMKVAIHQKKSPIISFGGAYSNHLVALATLANQLALPMIAIIRGEAPPLSKWNARLHYLASLGVKLHFVSREEYGRRYEKAYCRQWLGAYPNAVLIPEGGSNVLALEGIGEMVQEVRLQCDQQSLPDITHWICPIGSGGTTAGLLRRSGSAESVIAVSALKGAVDLPDRIASLLSVPDSELSISNPSAEVLLDRLFIDHNYHFGGYARTNHTLNDWVTDISQQGLPVEFVYSGKMLFALKEKLSAGEFLAGSHIICIHTGGVWPEELAA